AGALRARRLHAGRTTAALALGAFFGLLAVAVHSVADFGVHIPAGAALLAGGGPPGVGAARAGGGARGGGGRGPGPGAPGPGLAGVGGLAAWQGGVMDGADRYRRAAAEAAARDDPEAAVLYLEAAARFDPSDARLQHDLGQAHFNAGVAAALPDEKLVHAVKTLWRFRLARDLSPVSPQSQMRLGMLCAGFQPADPAGG